MEYLTFFLIVCVIVLQIQCGALFSTTRRLTLLLVDDIRITIALLQSMDNAGKYRETCDKLHVLCNQLEDINRGNRSSGLGGGR